MIQKEWCYTPRSASFNISPPRSVGAIERHSPLKALRAAATAMSTSSAEAAYTEVISFSSLEIPSLRFDFSFKDWKNQRRIDTGDLLATFGRDELVVDEET